MELLERGPALLELSRLLAEADDGHGRLAFLGGEAGVGKTSLIRRFADLVEDRTPVLIGGCDPLSTPQPFAPLLDIADRLPDPGISVTGKRDQIFRDLLSLMSTKETLVLVFEDVHWADEATLDLLRFVARRIHDRRALLIATYRDDEAGDRHPLRHTLGDVATAAGVRRLALQPLSLASVQALAANSGMDAKEVFRQTGGNPFFVTEVIATAGQRVPATVRDAVLARAARIPEAARAVLEAASVIGFRAEPWLLERVAGDDAGATRACLESGILTSHESSYTFRHELARMAILGSILPRRRVELHRLVLDGLRTLRESDRDPARLAHHAEEAGDGEAVIRHAPEAARRASRVSAHREAIAQYTRALRFADRLDPDSRAELLDEYAHECAATDRYDEAVAACRQVRAHWHERGDRVREGAIMGFLCGCLVSNARIEEAEDVSTASIQLLESFPPGAELAEAYARRSRLKVVIRDTSEGIAWAQKALDLAVALGDERVRIIALNRLGSALLSSGDHEGDRILRETLDLARNASLHVEATGVFMSLASGWVQQGEFARADPYIDESITFAEEHQLEGSLSATLGWQAVMKLYMGRWSEVEQPARRVLRREGVNIICRRIALTALGLLAVRRGDADAGAILDELLAIDDPPLSYLPPARTMHAEQAWLAGDFARARAEAKAALVIPFEQRHPWFAGELISWLAMSGERAEAPEWIALPYSLQLSGDWKVAADEWRRRGCPYESAQALAESESVDDKRLALAEFERLGAVPAAKRLRRILRSKGVRRIPRGPHASTRSNERGLTRREVEIASLLSEGLRNNDIAERLFLSPKTVDHHVSSVLSKLGVQNRGQVAREAGRLGFLKNGETKEKN